MNFRLRPRSETPQEETHDAGNARPGPARTPWTRYIPAALAVLLVCGLVAAAASRFLITSGFQLPLDPAGTQGSQRAPAPGSGIVGRAAPADPPTNDWPMYGHDPSRTNFNPDETALSPANVDKLVPIWQYNIGMGSSPSSSTPSISGGMAYVGSSVTKTANFLALDALTGRLEWSTTLGHVPTCFNVGIGATAAISGSVVVAGGTDAAYYGLDAGSGTILWRHALDVGASAYPWASPLIWGNQAYIGIASGCDNPSVRGEVRSISLKDGTTLASQAFVPEGKAGAGIWNSPALTPDGKTLAVATGEDFGGYNGPYNRAMVSLDPGSLLIRQSYKEGPTDTDRDFATTPIIFHDRQGRTLVAAHHKDENLYVYDLNRIAAGPIWHRHTGTIVGMMPAYDPTFHDGGTLFFVDGVGNLHAVDPATGADVWPPAVTGSVRGNMAIANGVVFVNAGQEGLRVFSEKDGHSLGDFMPDHPGKSYSGLAIAQGIVYWVSGGYLNAWSLPSGLGNPAH